MIQTASKQTIQPAIDDPGVATSQTESETVQVKLKIHFSFAERQWGIQELKQE